MKIYLVGNRSVDSDSTPVKLKRDLIRFFPGVEFVETDPAENFIPAEDSVIIDTVAGLDEVKLFDNLSDFVSGHDVSVHDYDLYLHLRLLIKLGKLVNLRIIGLPQKLKVKDILQPVSRLISLLS
jgi:hypothetical protein